MSSSQLTSLFQRGGSTTYSYQFLCHRVHTRNMSSCGWGQSFADPVASCELNMAQKSCECLAVTLDLPCFSYLSMLPGCLHPYFAHQCQIFDIEFLSLHSIKRQRFGLLNEPQTETLQNHHTKKAVVSGSLRCPSARLPHAEEGSCIGNGMAAEDVRY